MFVCVSHDYLDAYVTLSKYSTSLSSLILMGPRRTDATAATEKLS